MRLSNKERAALIEAITEGVLSNMAAARANVAQKRVELSQAKTDKVKSNPLNKVNPAAYGERARRAVDRKIDSVKSSLWNRASKAAE